MVITTDTIYGDQNDVASGTDASAMANNMVIVKVNGDYTVNSGVTVSPYYNEYGGPKGFMLYVTGKLTNNGIIDNSHGAYAAGENVYLWKNSDSSFEFIPATGALGLSSYYKFVSSNTTVNGESPSPATGRKTGAGASGTLRNVYNSGNGANIYSSGSGSGTSYSGGVGGGGSYYKLDNNFNSISATGGSGGSNYGSEAGNGAGNPSGGTGGLLVIYADEYENNGTISAKGHAAPTANYVGGGSGGGSINIITNQATNASLTTVNNTKYSDILGNVDVTSESNGTGGVGGTGTVNIGEIRNNQYYDLHDIITQDIETYSNAIVKTGDSILSILNDNQDLTDGYWKFRVTGNGETITYPVHLIVLNGNQTITEDIQYGDESDCATGSNSTEMAKAMVIVKVNGDYTVNTNVIVGPVYHEQYGGPKGFMLYVTGKLTNNGTIDNSYGAYAAGENVYLWSNSNNTYEMIPAVGALGLGVYNTRVGSNKTVNGKAPTSVAADRQTGAGASGALRNAYNSGNNAYIYSPGSGSGTSYSGGVGGGASYYNRNSDSFTSVSNNGGSGGAGYGTGAGNGAGNPSGGTGGLLIIYANRFENNGLISAKGHAAPSATYIGGGSGGGSINIFTNEPTNADSSTNVNTKYSSILGNTDVTCVSNGTGGVGGSGTVNIGEIRNGQYYDLKAIIQQDIDASN